MFEILRLARTPTLPGCGLRLIRVRGVVREAQPIQTREGSPVRGLGLLPPPPVALAPRRRRGRGCRRGAGRRPRAARVPSLRGPPAAARRRGAGGPGRVLAREPPRRRAGDGRSGVGVLGKILVEAVTDRRHGVDELMIIMLRGHAPQRRQELGKGLRRRLETHDGRRRPRQQVQIAHGEEHEGVGPGLSQSTSHVQSRVVHRRRRLSRTAAAAAVVVAASVDTHDGWLLHGRREAEADGRVSPGQVPDER